MKTTSLTDTPREAFTHDDFGITPFEKGLMKFIENTSTPITLALQGEWGSGKTSLMNILKYDLCDSDNSSFFPVWINTWEYALMQDAQSTLVQIITKLVGITTSIVNPNGEKRKEVLEKVKRIGYLATKFALNSSVGVGAGEILNPLLECEKSSIGDLRDDLQLIINNAIKRSNKKGILFFIDDLDRIDPRIAVELLELLKNIFTLDNCVFILAIDYDVVIKGLKPKFGELTYKNEREFRSFFDKIIQVPFSMPVNSYKIEDFLKHKLFDIGYISKEESLKPKFIANMAKVASLTVGSNPRGLKRLLNSLSLIKCINDAQVKSEFEDHVKLTSELDLYINFALVSIQIAYPKVYRLLSLQPDFVKWNEGTAIQLNLKNLDEKDKQRLSTIEEFDEEWEQVLYRLCETDFFLKQKALSLSELLNDIRTEIIKTDTQINDDNLDIIGEYIERIIRLSAITNLEANDCQPINYNASIFIKNLRDSLIAVLKKNLPFMADDIVPSLGNIKTNASFTIKDMRVNFISEPHKGQIRIRLYHECKICYNNRTNGNITTYFMNMDKLEELSRIENDYNRLHKKYSRESTECYDSQEFMDSAFLYKGIRYFNLKFYLTLPNTEDFVKPEYLNAMSEIVEGIYETYSKLSKYREKSLTK